MFKCIGCEATFYELNGLKIGIRLDRHQVTQLVDLLQATQATFLEAWN